MSVLRELPYLAAIAVVLVVGLVSGSGAKSAQGPVAPTAEEISLSERVTPSGKIDLLDLEVGDCLPDLPLEVPQEVEAVPCREPHDAEVYAVFDLSDRPWPGQDAIDGPAARRCEGRLERDDPSTEAIADTLTPSRATWIELDDREVICLARYPTAAPGRRHP